MEEREAREDQASEVLEAAGNSQMCRVSDHIPFDCIAITAPNPSASAAYLDELVARLDGGGTKEVMIIAVSDPEGVRIGSGGGTLNAVLEVSANRTTLMGAFEHFVFCFANAVFC